MVSTSTWMLSLWEGPLQAWGSVMEGWMGAKSIIWWFSLINQQWNAVMPCRLSLLPSLPHQHCTALSVTMLVANHQGPPPIVVVDILVIVVFIVVFSCLSLSDIKMPHLDGKNGPPTIVVWQCLCPWTWLTLFKNNALSFLLCNHLSSHHPPFTPPSAFHHQLPSVLIVEYPTPPMICFFCQYWHLYSHPHPPYPSIFPKLSVCAHSKSNDDDKLHSVTEPSHLCCAWNLIKPGGMWHLQ